MVTIKDFADACRAEGLMCGAENDSDERSLACSIGIRDTRSENNLVRTFWNVHRKLEDARWSIIAAVSMDSEPHYNLPIFRTYTDKDRLLNIEITIFGKDRQRNQDEPDNLDLPEILEKIEIPVQYCSNCRALEVLVHSSYEALDKWNMEKNGRTE